MTRAKVAVFGEALFDMIQQSDGDYRPYIGGSPFNVARSFVRQGLECTYLSPIADDYLGEQIYLAANQEGVELPIDNRSTKSTSLALVYKDDSGQPSYRLYRKSVADLDINAEKMLSIIPSDIDLFHTGSLALVPEMLDVLIPVITQLKKRGVKISIDVNVRKNFDVNHEQYVAAIWRFIEFADVVKVSDEDLHLKGLYGEPEFHAKAMLDRMSDGLVALTLGAEGSQLFGRNIHIKQAVHHSEVFGDTVGAGDTFFSAMIAYMLRNNILRSNAEQEGLEDALRFASRAAEINVRSIGCNPPTFEQVMAELAIKN